MASLNHSDDGDAIMVLKKTSLEGYPIKDACANPECVVMTTFNGRVYTCDPTGVSKPENYVGVIFPTSGEEDEPDVDIVSVCCGRHHFLALSADGRVYSWSRNNVGQLGIRKKKKKKRHHERSQTTQDFKPRLIEELSNYDVIQIACGDDHSLALTRDRRLFSWGCNLHGQLGVNTKEQAKPFEIEGLWGIPLQHIAAGGAHSVALSTTGSIFVWGSNTHGQLGLQQLDDVKLPVKLGSLSQGNVKVVSCGMYHTSFLQQNGQLLVYGMGVDRCSCDSDEWGEIELRPGQPERFRTFSLLESTSRCTYAVDDVTHGIFVLDHDKVQQGGGLQLEPLEGGSMIDVFEPGSSTDWPPGRYGFDPKVWEPSRPVEDYELVERFEAGTRRDDVADTNTIVRETEQQERSVTDSNHGDSDGCTTEAQDTKEHDSINDREFGRLHVDGSEDFFDCSSSIDDAYSDDDSYLTCDEDDVSIFCDTFHDDPGVGCSHIDEQEDISRNHADSVETSPEPHSKSFDEHIQSTKDKERSATDTGRTATELHSQQSGSNISKSNTCSEERIMILSSDAATHPVGHLIRGTADTAEEGVSVMNEPALHVDHPVPFEGGITDLSATLDTISVTNGHDCPERETVEDVSGEAVVGQEINQRPARTWRRLCAGQENIFIIEQDEPMRKDVQISVTPGREIDTLSAELLQSLSDVEGDITEEDALFQYASMVFSSPACLNASFRQTGPNEVNGLNIDLKATRRAFEVISKNDKLLEKLSDVISVDLCNIVPQSIPHVEALRFIFILMECPVFSNPHRLWGRRALAAADRLMGYLHSESKAGENMTNSATPARWWKFEPMSFRRTVTAYRLSLTTIFRDRALLEKELDNFRSNLRVLSYLNEINLQHDILSIQTFYIQDLDKVWKHPPRPLQKFSWTSYPFLIDLEMKTKMLQSHNKSEQVNAMVQHTLFGLSSVLWDPQHVSLLLEVNREDIFGRSVREQLAKMLSIPRSKLQIPLMVNFMDETGIDAGALSMDFFRLVFEVLLDPKKNDLFRYVNEFDPTHSSVWFRKDCEDSELAEICGLLFGLSLYNKAIVALPFPQLLYAKLLGKGPNSDMEEAAELDKEFADQMSKLRTGTQDYVMGCCYGEKVELEDGRSVDVTKENVDLYVDNMVRENLVLSQFAAFQQGFNRVFNPAAFDMFRPIELEALVMGEKHFDWKALEQSTQYIQPYTDSHPTIKMFWKVFHALDNDMKRKFLVFVAGSDRVPVGGLRNLGLHIDHFQVPMDDSVDDQPCDIADRLTRLLPVGHGCGNHGFLRTLRLPMYTSLELMEDRLTVALSYYDCPFHIA